MVNVQHYNPSEIFTDNNKITGNTHNFNLAKAFYNSRYEDNLVEASFARNAGAVQIFNINGINSIVDPCHSISNMIKIGNNSTSFGHSERLGMRDLLNNFIPEDNGEIERPSYYVLSPNLADQQLEILQALVNHTNEYKTYLTNQDVIVKMWSERTPCDYDAKGGGGKCADFIQSILPEGSEYGYITEVPQYSTTEQIKILNQKASTDFQNAYLDEVVDPLGGLALLFEEQLQI